MTLTNDTIITYINNVLHIVYDKDIIIDPCASNDDLISMIDTLAQFTFHYDMNKKVNSLDFLSLDFQQFDKTVLAGLWYDKVHIISRPQPEMIGQFLKKCSEFADTISFILPKDYLSPILSNYHLLLSIELDEEWILKVWERKPNNNN
jgi:hypothetical protein